MIIYIFRCIFPGVARKLGKIEKEQKEDWDWRGGEGGKKEVRKRTTKTAMTPMATPNIPGFEPGFLAA